MDRSNHRDQTMRTENMPGRGGYACGVDPELLLVLALTFAHQPPPRLVPLDLRPDNLCKTGPQARRRRSLAHWKNDVNTITAKHKTFSTDCYVCNSIIRYVFSILQRHHRGRAAVSWQAQGHILCRCTRSLRRHLFPQGQSISILLKGWGVFAKPFPVFSSRPQGHRCWSRSVAEYYSLRPLR